jgi:hypothetical protein
MGNKEEKENPEEIGKIEYDMADGKVCQKKILMMTPTDGCGRRKHCCR